MEGLTEFVQDVVRHVDDYVDGAQTQRLELTTQPVGALGDLEATDHKPLEARAKGLIDSDRDRHGASRTSGRCGEHLGELSLRGLPLLSEISSEIAGDAVVRSSIDTVRRDIDLEDVVGADTEVLSSRRPRLRRSRIEEDDPAIVVPDTDLYLTAEHTEALDATDLALLDGEGFVTRGEDGTDGSDDDRLTSGYIGRTTDDLQGCLGTYIYCRDVEVIGVLMHIAGQHVTDDKALEPTGD